MKLTHFSFSKRHGTKSFSAFFWKVACVATSVLSLGGGDLRAIDWIGGTGAWSDASLWDPATVPYLGDSAVVSNGGTVVVESGIEAYSSELNLGRLQNTSGNLQIDAGGSLLSYGDYLGFKAESMGSAVVGGTWVNLSLHVGYSGTGAVRVEASGIVWSSAGVIGTNEGSIGSAEVHGSWISSEGLTIGRSGNGVFDLKAGGELNSNMVTLGEEDGSVGQLTVGGSLGNSDSIYIGRKGAGSVDVKEGGSVWTINTMIGHEAGGTGSLEVDGTFEVASLLTVGHEGEGSLVVNGGHLITSYSAVVGHSETGRGSVEVVSGTWSAVYVTVGQSGAGTLSIDEQSLMQSWTADVGSLTTGSVTVAGGWQNLLTLNIGTSGTGRVDITATGSAISRDLYLGVEAGSSGILNVSGSLETEDALGIGVRGSGTMNVEDGGQVRYDAISVGVEASGTGRLNVSSGEMVGGALTIGEEGKGTLNLGTEGVLENQYGTLGLGSESNGEALVDGTLKSQELNVGYYGTGVLKIGENGFVQSGTAYIGREQGGAGSAEVSGTWIANGIYGVGDFNVGHWGEGHLVIKDGGSISGAQGVLGVMEKGSGTATIESGGMWETLGLTVGFYGNGTLEIEQGGTVSDVGWDTRFGYYGIGTGHVSGLLKVKENLYVGDHGEGYLTIKSGGRVESEYAYIGSWYFMDWDTWHEEFGRGSVVVEEDGYWGSTELTIASSGKGFLEVERSGLVESVKGFIATDPSASGTAVIRGKWVSDSLYVAGSGRGSLLIEEGGEVAIREGYVGMNFYGAKGDVTVETTGKLIVSERFVLGVGGWGDLYTDAGSMVSAPTFVAGIERYSVGMAFVSGTLTVSEMILGAAGGGSLIIEKEGRVSSDTVIIGTESVGGGYALVSGSWQINDLLVAGAEGTATIDIKDGGRLNVREGNVHVGMGAEAAGVINIQNGRLNHTGEFWLGEEGTGTLTVGTSGTLSSGMGYMGREKGGQGSGVVEGLWELEKDLYIGLSGSGALSIGRGGVVKTRYGTLGFAKGGSGTLEVDGGTWQSEELIIGYRGSGGLNIKGNGVVSTGYASIGFGAASSGGATVSRGRLNIDGDMNIGAFGSGFLKVGAAGSVANERSTIGAEAGSLGVVEVEGDWTLRTDLLIGGHGVGRLDIGKGGTVQNRHASIGAGEGSEGVVTVAGRWNNLGDLIVGDEGLGELNVRRGGYLESRNASIGLNAKGTGRATIDGSWYLFWESLSVGTLGQGELTIGTHGSVDVYRAVVGEKESSVGRVTLSGTWMNTEFILGYQGRGDLEIKEGGVFDGIRGELGYAEGASGSAVVHGVWDSRELTIGYHGKGDVQIGRGGSITTTVGFIGYEQTGKGKVTVKGEFTAFSSLTLGNKGQGILEIEKGGRVHSTSALQGFAAGASGKTAVHGVWENEGDLVLGYFGTGDLAISKTGRVDTGAAYLAFEATSEGEALVAGKWTNRGGLVVGNKGTGFLNIKKGGSVSSFYGELGALAGSAGMVAVAGEWEVTNNLVVGDEGEGTLTIKTEGRLENSHAYVGMGYGGTGQVFVDGAWKNRGDLVVGFEGKGTLVVEKKGTLSDINSLLGGAEGAYGTAFVGGSWKNAGDLVVGNSGEAELSIVEGGRVESARGFIGLDHTGRGMAFVDGQWRNTEDLVVGFGGGGLLSVGMRGSVSSANAQLGYMENSKGAAFVQGKWKNAGALILGNQGEGELVVMDGGRVESTDAYLGFDNEGSGAAFIEKGRWENNGDLIIGNFGEGGLIVDVEGYAKARNIILGRSNGSWGFVTISGTLEAGGDLAVGRGGYGTFIVLEGGRVTVSGGVTLDEGKTESSIMLSGEEGQRGSLETANIIASSHRARLVFDGGIVRATRDQNNFLSGFAPGKIEFHAGGGFIDSDKNRISIDSVIKGPGGLIKQGTGTLLLSGSNRFTGNSFIREGTVRTENTRALGLGSVTLKTEAALDVKGRLRLNDFTWEGGGLVALTSPSEDRRRASSTTPTGSAEGSIALRGTFAKAKGDEKFVFKLSGFDSPNTTYTLLNFSESRGFKASDFSSNGFYGLKTTFDLKSDRLLLSYEGVSSGPYLQNTAYVYTPRDAHFVVDGPVLTGKTKESNRVQSLFFKTDSSLLVRNTLTVSSGRFIAISGTSTLKGDSIVTPDHFTKLGHGLFIVDAAMTAGGTGTIAEGGVQLQGEIRTGSGLVIGNGSFLSGDGRVKGGLDVQGTLSPGLGIGKIHIEGDYTTTPNGLLLVEVASRNKYDSVAVEGTADLGGTLALAAREGFQFDYGQRFTVVEADKVTGKYRQILVPGGFRSRLLVDETTASVLLAPESYTTFARTPNDEAIATALDSFISAERGDREVVSIALDSLAADEYSKAFQQIAPNFYETLVNMTFEQSNAQGQMLQQRFGALRLGIGGFSQSGLNVPVVTENAGRSHCRQDLKEARNIMESSLENPWGVWVQGNGLFASESSLANLPNYRYNSGGLLLGVDYRWSPWLSTGIYTSYQNTHARYDGGGSTRISGVRFGTYATFDAGNGFYANGLLGGGGSAFKVRRTIQFGSIDRVARSTPSGGDFTAMLGGGYDFTAGIFTVGPIASAQYTHTRIGVVSEHGADSLNLRLEEQSANSLLSTLGVRVATTWKLSPSFAIIPEGRVTWQHEFLRDARDLTGSLDGGSGPGFTTRTASLPRDSVFAGAGLNFQFGRDWSANLYYNADFGGGNFKSQMVSGGVDIKF